MTDQEKRYLRHLDYKLKCLISRVNSLDPSNPGGDNNYAYGLPVPEYDLEANNNQGAFLTVDQNGNLSSIGLITDDIRVINIENEYYTSILGFLASDNELNDIPINKGRIGINSRTYNGYNINAIDISGDLSVVTENPYHNGFLFTTDLIDSTTDLIIYSSTIASLPDFQSFYLNTNDGEFKSGFENGNLTIDSTAQDILHFPRMFVGDENEGWYFGLNSEGYIQYGPDNNLPYYFLPKEHVTNVGKVIISSNNLGNTEWKFIDSNRVKQDTSGVLSIVPDYNEGNVHEYTAIGGGVLSIDLPVNMPNGANMTLRFLPTATTSFTPESSYIFNTTKPADLVANKFVEMQIRKFQNNFYVNLIIWE